VEIYREGAGMCNHLPELWIFEMRPQYQQQWDSCQHVLAVFHKSYTTACGTDRHVLVTVLGLVGMKDHLLPDLTVHLSWLFLDTWYLT
jgi:hypothetical protein